VAAGRISFSFGLQGPSVPVETACSSSLVALHTLSNSVILGQCNSAISGGVNMLLIPSTTAMFQKANMLAIDGRCKTLSDAADGYARADSCGTFFVSGELNNGIAIIQGTAVNQDGRSSSLTAPNGPAQQSVMRTALRQGSNHAENLSALQMHGTGTGLGDPIEVGAIGEVIGNKAGFMPVVLTAAKSWSGHSEAAAGIVGLSHAQCIANSLLSLPVLHLRGLNPYIYHSKGQWSAPRQLAPRLDHERRSLIGISAFAFQGTNAHCIISHTLKRHEPVSIIWNKAIAWVATIYHRSIESSSIKTNSINLEINFLRSGNGSYIMDHRVLDRILVPGAALMEATACSGKMILSRGSENVCLTNFVIPSPVSIDASSASGESTVSISVQKGSGKVTMASDQGIHLGGEFSGPTQKLVLTRMPTRSLPLPLPKIKEDKTIVGLLSPGTELVARDVSTSPAQIDSCFQLGAIRESSEYAVRVPTGAGCYAGMHLRDRFVHGLCKEESRSRTETVLDYYLSPTNAQSLKVLRFLSKPIIRKETSRSTLKERQRYRYGLEWRASESSMESAPLGSSLRITLQPQIEADNLCTAAMQIMQKIEGRNLNLVTCNGLHISESSPVAPRQLSSGDSALWGLMRSVNLEMPGCVKTARDIPSEVSRTTIVIDQDHNVNPTDSPIFGEIENAHVVRKSALQEDRRGPSKVTADLRGNFTITGGTGSLGSLAASFLSMNSGAHSIHLLSRSGAMKTTGISYSILHANLLHLQMSNPSFCEDAQSFQNPASGELSHLLHAGGALYDGTITKQSPASIRGAFAPKYIALARIRNAQAFSKLGVELLFSSVASLLGSAGQTNYSAANSLLDNMSAQKQSKGLQSVSAQWGAWQGGGMASQDKSTVSRIERLGMGLVKPEQGLQGIMDILTISNMLSQLAVVPFLWDKMYQRMKPEIPFMFKDLAQPLMTISSGTLPARKDVNAILAVSLLRKKKKQQKRTSTFVPTDTISIVSDVVRSILGRDVDPSEPLMSAGLDSLTSVELKNTLEGRMGITLPSTIVFDYPSISAIGEYLSQLGESSGREEESKPAGSANKDQMVEIVLRSAESILGRPVAATEPLMSAGMDSLTSVEFKNALESQIGLTLPSTLIFDLPNASAIGEYIAEASMPTHFGESSDRKEESKPAGSANKDQMVEIVLRSAESILGRPVAATEPLMSAGMDSLTSVEFKNALESQIGLTLPSTLIFDLPNASAIGEYIAEASMPTQSPHADDDHGLIASEIHEAIKAILRQDMPDESRFVEYISDEKLRLRLLRSLEARLGVRLPGDLFSQCPTPKDLTSFILITPLEVAGSHIEAMETEEIKIFKGIQSSLGGHSSTMVPIVGMAATLPGNALYRGSLTPVDGCRLIGEDRWDPDLFVKLTGDRAVRFAGIIDNVSLFDPEAFWIADKEAILMDPQQRLVLETVAESMAQFSNKLRFDSCGTFVGCSSHDYLKMSLAVTGITAYTGTGTSSSVVSGRLSYTFGFQGPAMTIDTACSSSLVGMHMAFNCIDLGQCITASGSGVNIILHPTTLATLQKAGMLTYDGRCKTLDASADGYVRAEAVGSLLLHAGEVNSNECLCFLMGSFVNQDGRSSALTAPNGPAQTGVVKSALHLSNLSPSEIDSLQMHGTGTSLGDPIEVGAANASFIGGKEREMPLILMASKSWMGHAEPAAGVAGLTHTQVTSATKCVMQIMHLKEMNPYVVSAIGSSECMHAPRENLGVSSVTIVGTSAFAFQGTNAHVIMAGTDIVSVQTRPKYIGDNRSLVLRKKHLWLAPATSR